MDESSIRKYPQVDADTLPGLHRPEHPDAGQVDVAPALDDDGVHPCVPLHQASSLG